MTFISWHIILPRNISTTLNRNVGGNICVFFLILEGKYSFNIKCNLTLGFWYEVVRFRGCLHFFASWFWSKVKEGGTWQDTEDREGISNKESGTEVDLSVGLVGQKKDAGTVRNSVRVRCEQPGKWLVQK